MAGRMRALGQGQCRGGALTFVEEVRVIDLVTISVEVRLGGDESMYLEVLLDTLAAEEVPALGDHHVLPPNVADRAVQHLQTATAKGERGLLAAGKDCVCERGNWTVRIPANRTQSH